MKRNALVLSGGGVKGAFEAGAVYHLVVQRNCDFSEFSGVSVGALNAVFLAQARASTDPLESHLSLVEETEALVSLWQSLTSSRDFARNRPLATVRFGLFGLENLYDMQPLRRLEQTNISLEKLAEGRAVRVGVVSFHDGTYREIVARPGASKDLSPGFLDYLFASSTPPVYGKLPMIADASDSNGPRQIADGGLRHITPLTTYFVPCATVALPAESIGRDGNSWSVAQNCNARQNLSVPAHEPVQQLFVIVTSPYAHGSDLLPVPDSGCCRPGMRQFTDGRKILSRTMELMDDAVFRWDIDYLLSANDMLRWRREAYERLVLAAPIEELAETKRQFQGTGPFALESYNKDPGDPEAPSLPYEIGLVTPGKEFADLKQILALSPDGIQQQLYCGCIAADQMMQTTFGLTSLANKCAARFPGLRKSTRERSSAMEESNSASCRAAPLASSMLRSARK